ncbi:energy-coupling factor ABC transporter ATP-binding protein [Methanohalophilus euhalobius]|jgi:cobalt/nickel transport system ATP-binding protein|uniref:ATP-binding cassette domain-containing protein n=1 Tax=Methanohalophilus euhalobius TaxID=51203 RepID=A0A314ZY15_9EURY|nr:ATP-binding cassette domain-containing protein [Methanohalophilus euhalobius]PQV43023.1 cobalt/nickel transport system ATP-binding protein [Methanohalophilus euhalobius]RNI09397.1 ATP-binding cassette domain-containing protein [Methanohalophilus euhalobius]
MNEAISVRNLNYAYPDGTLALKDIELHVKKGEKIGILGPNGAGKTTLFMHLNGVIKNPDGEVNIFNQDISSLKTEERIHRVGVVFQDPDDQLFMPTIFDDVAFGPINMGLNKEEVQERVSSALKTVGLSGFEERVPHNLSYGQKKRAAIAAVLSMGPKILILDEPTANLDPRSKAELIKLVNRLNSEGITTIIASHEVNTLPELVDRIYIINREIIAEGTPREIFSDWQLLRDNNLEAPDVFKLFQVLTCFGYDCEKLPLSINEAVEELTKTIESGKGHVHLHIHEHTHRNVSEYLSNYNHHS